MRLRRLDAFLIAVMVPIWAAGLGIELFLAASGRPTVWAPALRLAPANDGHPVVGWIQSGSEASRALAPGDVLLRVGADDLTGASGPRWRALLFENAQTGIPVPLTVRRDGREVDVRLDIRRPHALGVAPFWAA